MQPLIRRSDWPFGVVFAQSLLTRILAAAPVCVLSNRGRGVSWLAARFAGAPGEAMASGEHSPRCDLPSLHLLDDGWEIPWT